MSTSSSRSNSSSSPARAMAPISIHSSDMASSRRLDRASYPTASARSRGGAVEPPEDSPIPAHYREAAEEVRAHLCALRGGGLFLSPMDSWKLVQWLDRGVK